MSSSKFLDDQRNSFNQFGTGDALNNGLANDQILKDQYSAQPEAGANTFPLGTPANHAIFQPVNTQIYQNPSAQLEAGANTFPLWTSSNHAIFQPVNAQIYQNQPAQLEAYPSQFGTDINYAMSHKLVNVQLPRQWDQAAEDAINVVNPSMTNHMNLCQLAKPGSSHSSNISNVDLEKRLKKRESDRKSREKKEKMRKDNEENLAEVTEENNHLRTHNASLLEGQVTMKKDLQNFKEKVSDLEGKLGRLNNKLKGQNKKVEALSEKLVASSEATDLVVENKQLKRRIELLETQLGNPDSMKIVELHEEIDKWKRKAKRLQVINEALCDKMNNDEQ